MHQVKPMTETTTSTSLPEISSRLYRLQGKREDLNARQCNVINELEQINQFLEIGDVGDRCA